MSRPWRPSPHDLGKPPRTRSAAATARLAILALVLGAIGIGFAPLFVRLSPVGPSATAFYRFLLALPLLALFVHLEADHMARRGRPLAPPGPRTRRLMVLAGLFFAGDIAFWHHSILTTTVANATLLTNFAPVFVTLGAWILFRERPTPLFALGLLFALVGAALLVGTSAHVDPKHVLGDLLGLASGLFYAAYQLTIKRVRRDRSAIGVILGSTAVSAVAMLVFTLLTERDFIATSGRGWLLLLALALVSQVIGQGSIVYGLAHLPSGFSSVTLLVQPLVAALLAWTLLEETLAPTALVGGLVVLVGIILARFGSAPSKQRAVPAPPARQG